LDSFDAFYERHFADVAGLVRARTGSSAAEDLAQEAFIILYKNWELVRTYDNPGAWVRKIALRRATRWMDRGRLEGEVLARAFVDSDPMSFPDLPTERADFWRTVQALPRRQIEVLLLHYQAEFSVAEIAAHLGVHSGTVKRHLYDARKNLAMRLKLEGGQP
jgi:RNA polymerase sigma-70 factor (ECF subfamily)